MYRDMRYVVDLRHPLQAPCGGDSFRFREHEKTYIQSSRPWECGNPEGISKECGKGGKPASWLSILCHFHGLFCPATQINKLRHLAQYTAPTTTAYRDRLSMSSIKRDVKEKGSPSTGPETIFVSRSSPLPVRVRLDSLEKLVVVVFHFRGLHLMVITTPVESLDLASGPGI